MVRLDCNCIIRISPHLCGYLNAKPKDQSLDNSVIRDSNLKISGLYLCVCFYSPKKCPWTKSSLMMERRKEWSASRNEIERKKESEVAYRVQLFATPWTVAYQTSQSMEFSRQEYWSGLPFPPSGDLPNPGIKPRSPALQADALPSEPPGKPRNEITMYEAICFSD